MFVLACFFLFFFLKLCWYSNQHSNTMGEVLESKHQFVKDLKPHIPAQIENTEKDENLTI